MTKNFISFIFYLFFLLLIPIATMAETYYVATNGNNGFPGTQSKPWQTISYAITQISSGDEVLVRGGIYNEQVKIQKPGVTIRNYPNERPVIDGQNKLPSGNQYDKLVLLKADNIIFEGFDVKNSLARGIVIIYSNHSVVRNCVVSNTAEEGIVLDTNANYATVEFTEVHHHNMNHIGGTNRPWGGGITLTRNKYSTVRGCNVHEGYGEGILFARNVDNGTVEFCTAYDNYAVQIYVDLSRNVNIRYNLVYGTKNQEFHRYPGAAGNAIVAACEIADSAWGFNINVYGNFIAGTGGGIHFWNEKQVIKGVKIFNNTVVETYRSDGTQKCLNIGNQYRDHQVKNNIFVQTKGTLASVPNAGTYEHNLWNKTPSYEAKGPGDVVGDPFFANMSALVNLKAGSLSVSDFSLLSKSTAIEAGTELESQFRQLIDCEKTDLQKRIFILVDQNTAGKNWEIGADVSGSLTAILPQKIELTLTKN